jgi:hypothetical protein
MPIHLLDPATRAPACNPDRENGQPLLIADDPHDATCARCLTSLRCASCGARPGGKHAPDCGR